MERADKANLEQLLALLDAHVILSLPSASNPLVSLNGKFPNLVLFCVWGRCRLKLTLSCVVVVACFAGIIGDFTWKLLVKQFGLASGTVPLSAAASVVWEEGQPAGEVSPVVIVVKVTPNAHSSVLAKRKQDDGIGSFGH